MYVPSLCTTNSRLISLPTEHLADSIPKPTWVLSYTVQKKDKIASIELGLSFLAHTAKDCAYFQVKSINYITSQFYVDDWIFYFVQAAITSTHIYSYF